jgi:ketosteroid isomerase-like protein
MNRMMGLALAVVITAACSSVSSQTTATPAGARGTAPANNQVAEQQAILVVQEWIAAVPKRDADRIGQLLGDDFVAILWDGKKHSKLEYLEEIRSGRYIAESITMEDTQARVLGDMAIVTYYQNEKSQSAGTDSSGSSVWTDVLARRNERWQVIAEHGTRFN